MLCFTDPAADDATLSTMSSTAAREHAPDMLRQARQAEARAIFMAYRIGQAVFDDFLVNPSRRRGIRDVADKAAVGEVSLQLGISRAQVTSWISLADGLQFLPKVRLAFLDGDFSISRARILIRALTALDSDLRAAAEPHALELAYQASADSTLRSRVEKLVIELDPDAAAEARKDFAERIQDVRIRSDAFGHAHIEATVSAEHGVYSKKKLESMIAARVCAKDGRSVKLLRVAALAELHTVPGARLACECGFDDCPQRGAAEVDVVADHAEESAVNDAYDAAALDVAIPLADDESDCGEDGSDDEAEGDLSEAAQTEGANEDKPEVEATGATEATEDDDPTPELELVVDPTDAEATTLVGHGAIDPEHAAEISEVATQRELPSGLIVVIDRPATPIDPTGHGGLTVPPPGALTYQPSRKLREQIESTDEICRYPMCGRPSHECQLDHVYKFDPNDPLAGGWTIVENLIPLCTPDHHRKHLGLWIPTLYTGRTVVWRNPATGQEITTYPR